MLRMAIVATALIASFIMCPVAFAQDADDEMAVDYALRLSGALTTHDRAEIQSMVDWVDQLIVARDTRTSSLHYNKAQLMYRLGMNDEALKAAGQSKTSKWYVATLLLRLGRDAEGTQSMESLIGEYRCIHRRPQDTRCNPEEGPEGHSDGISPGREGLYERLQEAH